MSEKQGKRINGFFKATFRRTSEWLIVVPLVFALATPFIQDANAKKRAPRIDIPATNGEPGTATGGQYSIPDTATSNNSPTDNHHSISSEIDDFNPHYGMPLWYISIPHPLPGIGRKTWCGPPIYVPIIGCLPWPNPTWCNEFPNCTMTNVINLISTLLIKHAYPKHQGRYEEMSKPGGGTDYYYRDLCINSAKLDFSQFDPNTGDLLATGPSRFDETSAGLVTGSKPLVNSCMPTIDTPNMSAVPGPYNTISPFAFYQNAGNAPFLSQGSDAEAKKTIYGTTPRFNSSTFFLGGSQGCPADIFMETPGTPGGPDINTATTISKSTTLAAPIPVDAKGWADRATRCYDYYISSRALHPEWTLERGGIQTDDPLTADNPRGNPSLAIFNSCQPLMSGTASELVKQGGSPTDAGFSPVLQYNRADLDEADYDTAQYYRKDFLKLFPATPTLNPPNPPIPGFPNLQMPNYQNIFPCVEQPNDGGPVRRTDWSGFNLILMINYAISFVVETVVLDQTWGPMYFVPMPEDRPYISPGGSKPGFCPNVEKINIASHPFSPRDDFRPEWTKASDKIAAWLQIEASPYEYLFNHKITYIYSNDREYSNQTSFLTPKDRLFNGLPQAGYSKYNAIMNKVLNNPSDVPGAIAERTKYPEVMCAIVPVDILEPRRKAFDNCIMQRINYNFITWRRRNFLSYYYKRTLDPWVKPCATRFYESDDVVNCPVSMSIQQCCRIIVKDVVPMNYLKIRTCEGLRQKRNLVFGYDHIYDATKKTSLTTQDTAAIAAAQAKLDQLRSDLANYIAHIPNGAWVTISLCREGMNASGDTQDANGNQIPICSMRCNHCPDYQPTLANYRDQITAAKAELEEARNKFITVTNEESVPSLGGKYMKVTDQASYDAALKENQKLTLLGCDETEPADYRFYHYFEKSNWPELPASKSRVLNDGISIMQETIDNIIYAAKVLANKEILIPADYAWSTYNAAIKAADNALQDAQEFSKRILYESQVENAKYQNAKSELEKLSQIGPNPNWSMLLMEQANLPTDVTKALQALAASKARLAVLSVSADKAEAIVEELKKAKEQVSKNAEDQLRNALKLAQSKIETNIIQTAKKNADDTATALITKLKNGPGKSVGDAIDQLYDKLNSDENSILNTGSASFDLSLSGSGMGNQMVNLIQGMLGAGGSHMPYMRWWDTGTSAGNPTHGGSFINTLGSYDTIIGVGREERNYDDANGLTLNPDQPKTQTSQMGRINGWAGLKGHQMLTTRHSNLVCIGRHEKLFKFTGQENFVLAKAGANYISKNPAKQWPWPLGWRGYITDPNNEFEKNLTAIGLDNAQEGDIIIYWLGSVKRISYVTGVNRYPPKFVRIESWDQSKFPTSSGTGLSAGSGVERTIYYGSVPPGALNYKDPGTSVPKNISAFSNSEIAKIGDQPSCEDPDFTSCVLGGTGNSSWENVEIFRPSENLRRCPYLDYSSASKNVQTSHLDTASISYCLNAGYDPPNEYRIGYNGPGTGAVSDLTRCGPNWGDCSTTAPVSEVKCFPNGTGGNDGIPCNTPLAAYTPPADPTAVAGECTDQQVNDATNAYNAALMDKTNALKAANNALASALQAQETAERNYDNYVDQTSATLAQLNSDIMESQIPGGADTTAVNSARNDLNTAIADLQAKQAAAATANQDLKNYIDAHQSEINSYEQIINDYNLQNNEDNMPPNVQQANTILGQINTNIDGFKASVAAASDAVATAQAAVADAQAAFNTAASSVVNPSIAPNPTYVAQRDAINANIASLQATLDAANQALANAQSTADAAQNDAYTVPPLKCPWP